MMPGLTICSTASKAPNPRISDCSSIRIILLVAASAPARSLAKACKPITRVWRSSQR